MIDQRLRAIYVAASKLFITKRYANTQVSEIAEAAAIATGTIYNLFAGKKALLHFVLLSTLDKQYFEREITFPIQEVDSQVILGPLICIGEELFTKIGSKTSDDKRLPSFAEMLSILFDYVADYHVAFSIINDNRDALPEIKAKYGEFVSRLYQVLEENLLVCIKRGEVRNVELPKLHIRNIVEEFVWWGMYLPYEVPDVVVPVSQAKGIVLDILRHAYLVNP